MLITEAEYARHRGKSRQAVNAWKKRGKLVLSGGLVDREASDKILDAGRVKKNGAVSTSAVNKIDKVDNASRVSAERQEAEPLLSADEMRQLLHKGEATQFQAERVKQNYIALKHLLEYEEQCGKLISKEDVQRKIFEKARIERDAWLNWPSRIAAKIAAEFGIDKAKFAVALDQYVREQLSERARVENASG